MGMDRKKLHGIYRYIIDWLYPNICPLCDRIIGYDADFCGDCSAGITPYTGHDRIKNTDGFTAGCIYDDNIKRAILRFKETNAGNFGYAFALRISKAVGRDFPDVTFDAVVPVPLSKGSKKKRGYNQSLIIARELSFMIDAPCADILIKPRETQMQKCLDMKSRLTNMQGAFELNKKAFDIKDKTILVIDDVCTTGSTLSEAARVLKESGAGKVYAAAFAKTPLFHK